MTVQPNQRREPSTGTTASDDTVVIRRRWNAPDTAVVSVSVLWGLHVRDEAGGVCRASPRAFLSAYVWCDQLAHGGLGHFCREGPPPHEVLVCILRNDNPAGRYEHLRALIRG